MHRNLALGLNRTVGARVDGATREDHLVIARERLQGSAAGIGGCGVGGQGNADWEIVGKIDRGQLVQSAVANPKSQGRSLSFSDRIGGEGL
ncbi:MAG: hypothetical protein ABW124_19910, partial [Candidatus Thiodiazotropha sp. 6PLUC9]